MRNLFPALRDSDEVYLDTAATALKPQVVVDAMARAMGEEYGTVHRAVYKRAARSTERYEEARQTVARFCNAKSADEIVFTRGTTDALNLIAACYPLEKGDEVAVCEGEHHANLVPWQLAAERRGIVIRWLPLDDAGCLKPFQLSPKTKVVAVAHASNVTGTIHPIADIVRQAHAVGAIVVVDGAQAAPHLPVDVQALGCDFYAFSGHKCYGPTGIGALWGRAELLEKMPPLQGGGDMIQRVTLEKTTFQKPPLRFEAGTPPIVEAIVLARALEFVQEHRGHKLPIELLMQELPRVSPRVRLIGSASERVPLVTFVVEGMHPLDIGMWLDLQGFAVRTGHLCAQPCLRRYGCEAAVRVSLGLYSSEEEIVRVCKSLSTAIDRF